MEPTEITTQWDLVKSRIPQDLQAMVIMAQEGNFFAANTQVDAEFEKLAWDPHTIPEIKTTREAQLCCASGFVFAYTNPKSQIAQRFVETSVELAEQRLPLIGAATSDTKMGRACMILGGTLGLLGLVIVGIWFANVIF